MAVAVERLIGPHGTRADVLAYTPREVDAFLRLSIAREKQDAANTLSLHALASRGDPKELEKRHKELIKP